MKTARLCGGCGLDISDWHGAFIYCSVACRKWRQQHPGGEMRVLATSCAQCGRSMAHKRAGAVYCSKTCKVRASDLRRGRDDAVRYQAERDRRRAYAIRYGQMRPEVGRAARNKRKALARNAGTFPVSGREWRRLCARYDGACYYCKAAVPLTMDHVIPLIRGGRHSIGNLIPACGPCNSSKSRRFIMEWRLASRKR